jgi:hypothetical protein
MGSSTKFLELGLQGITQLIEQSTNDPNFKGSDQAAPGTRRKIVERQKKF